MLNKHIDFVNEQIAFHKASAERYKNSKFRNSKHLETASRFEELLEYLRHASEELEEAKKRANSKSRPKTLRLSLTPEELEGLPQELLDELSSADRSEYLILNILEDAGGVASLDKILVELFRRTNEVTKRSTLTSRIYRMAQKNLVHSVPGKKGVYSLQPMSREDVEDKFEEPSDLFG